MSACIIIPARLDSSRLPHKVLLADAEGKTILEHCFRRALESGVGPVFIATPDQAILEAASGFGARVIQTSTKPTSGTERVLEAVGTLAQNGYTPTWIVNWQADEPELPGLEVQRLVAFASQKKLMASTLASTQPFDEDDPSKVKVVSHNGEARWFSREPLPEALRHIGVWCFHSSFAAHFRNMETETINERAERLEQLRWLDNGYGCGLMQTDTDPLEINTTADYVNWFRRSEQEKKSPESLDISNPEAIMDGENGEVSPQEKE